MRGPRYIAKWNGCGYAAHDTQVGWDISVHLTLEEAERACAQYEKEANQ